MSKSNMSKNLALVSVLLLALSACATIKKAVHKVGEATGDKDLQKAESKLSPSQQYYFGRTLAANFFSTSPYVSDKAVSEYVNLVGQYLAHHVDAGKGGAGPFKGFHFAVIKNPTPMAMSAPGGFVFVSTGMIEQLQSEDQLAGVLAHEIGHVMHEHGLDEIENEAIRKGIVKAGAKLAELAGADDAEDVGKVEAFSKVVDSGVGLFASQPHSRKHEIASDKFSVRLLARAGYNPAEYAELMATVTSGGFATKHPPGEDRLEAVNQTMVKLKYKDTRAARKTRFAAFKSAVARVAGTGVRAPAAAN
ncbi:MAG TPA: M48 family metalloprotease [Bdellovibrionales bacterium]|nr:M48 family metalloprotease [Bdellovibrionales bacterium]